MTGNIHFNDSVKANFGGSDSAWELEIYANSSNDAYIDKTATSVGDLIIQNQANDSDIIFKSDDGSGGITPYLTLDGGLGYTVASESIRLADGKVFYVGDDNDLGILHYSNNNYIQNNIGDLIIQNLADDKDIVFKSDDGSGGATPYLTLDGSSTGLTVSAPQGMVFFDNIKAKFGNNDDLQIYHDGSNSYIKDAGTGNLEIRSNFLKVKSPTAEDMIWAQENAGVTLFHNNVSKLATTSIGVIVSGSIEAVGGSIFVYDGNEFRAGDAGDLRIGHDATNSYLKNNTGDLYINQAAVTKSIIFKVSNANALDTTAITIDSSGNTTFAGDVLVGSGTIDNPQGWGRVLQLSLIHI